MSEDRHSLTDASTPSGDRIGRLLRLAGPRPAAPHERKARVKDSVRAQWQRSVRSRRRRRWLTRGGLGLAAVLALASMVGLFYRPRLSRAPVFAGPVAVVETVSGTVRLLGDGRGEGEVLRIGDLIAAGSVIDTGPLGRTAIRMASGSSLRLDRGTRLRGLTDVAVALESGAVYFDSGAERDGEPLAIRTPLGIVHDVGTLFEVRLDDGRMRLRVREGAVNLDRDGRLHDAGPGIELTVDAAGGLTRRSIPVFGPEWEWILTIAPTFELEGSTLDVFLEWVNRETGWQPRFVDSDSEAGASQVMLHGSVEGMRPDQALEAVLPTCGLVHQLDGGILVIQAEEI